MKSFTDKHDRKWELEISIGTLRRLQKLLEVNLYDDAVLPRLFNDVVLLVDVLYAILKPEADKRSIGDVEFGESFLPSTLEDAHAALMEELALFSRRPEIIRAAQLVWQKQTELNKKLTMHLQSVDVDSLADRIINGARQPQTLNGSSGSAPESSASSTSTP